ncbi:1-aminocyclopropane-1-carboxylate oxidase homolog 1-like [Cornus florida]|uniref:1-aminocyclopropane-1-carboxylate oxidase homolog 1-like n=1 Tax=Cornus florida TaxID=4283 RepID=UPI0028A06B4B|nr:1-aminocyclopropane-1-carboxylate oxidase homolog 1-like [Cornus florida]
MPDTPQVAAPNRPVYDRAKEVKEFDETKAGVKGLLDSGVVKIPRMFIHPPQNLEKASPDTSGIHLQVPLIDLKDLESGRRMEIVKDICKAAETWGFFQMVNHGIPLSVMKDLIEGVRRFHEQPNELKMKWYSRDSRQRVRYYCNGDLHISKAANWRDSIVCHFHDSVLESDALPLVCRKSIGDYMEHMVGLKETLCMLLSQALGLSSDFLTSIDCMKTAALVCHYYPFCPEPDLTIGTTKHSDPSYLTILLQDNIGGLQVLHQNTWVEVVPIEGALIANIGDLMQLITNDKFKSVEHRVLAGQVGPRISSACFFYPSTANKFKPCGPIKEFISDNNPPLYRETSHGEYHTYYSSKGQDGTSALPHFRLQ